MIVLSFSCKKAEDRKCLKSAGEETVKELNVATFNELFLGAQLNYVLVQGDEEKVVLRGGKNLVNFVDLAVENECLNITNTNSCNFLRSYKHELTVEIHLKQIREITFQGTKPLVCENKLICNDLTVQIEEGAGVFNLDVDCNRLDAKITSGWGNMMLVGNTNYLRLEAQGNGFADTYGLNVTDSLRIVSGTPRDIKVNVEDATLRSIINKDGDIWYIGAPQSIEHNQFGSGVLVDKN